MKHKTRLLLFLAFSTLTIPTFASTNVPASITTDTQWDASGSPYLIQGKVVVAKGATLHIGSGVQVIFQGPAAMEVNGTLDVEGSAAAPAVFRMTEGGLQNELFINGGTVDMTNVRVLSGVFLVQDSQLHLQWFEMTKGSGLYLRGNTTASMENGKIYGNATGVVLDGQVKANLEFNTITENTYGLYLKSFTDLDFTNNSIHDNDKEVINNTPSANLGNNYWGNSDEKTVQAKIQGSVRLAPLKTLKEVLRIYIRTQLPLITKQMETALKTQEKKEKQEALARQNPQKQPSASVATTEAPAAEASVPAVEQATPEPAEATPEAVEATEPESPGTMTAKVKELPAAPHALKPLANLPPDQGDLSGVAAVVPSASAETVPMASPSNPPVVVQPSAAAPAMPSVPEPPAAVSSTVPPVPPATDASAPPSLPTSDVTLPPALPTENTAASTVPVPPSTEVNSTSPPPVPPAGDVIAPPEVETATTPASSAGQNTVPTSSVPPPPDLTDQIPPAPAAAPPTSNTTATNPPAVSVPPVPPAPASSTDNSLAPPPSPVAVTQPAPATTSATANTTTPNPSVPAAPVAPPVSAEDQQKAVQSLDGVGGDIDGMQAPPLDLGPDLSSPTTANGSTSSPATSSPTTNPPSDSSLALPPLKDADVAPPKDLDLPPTDDLGNANIDSKK